MQEHTSDLARTHGPAGGRFEAASSAWAGLSIVGVGLTALLVVVAGLGVTLYAALGIQQRIAQDGEKRLRERATQTTSLITSVTEAIQPVLTSGSAVADATGGASAAFRREVRRSLLDTPILSNEELLEVRAGRLRVDVAVGRHTVLLPQCGAACATAVDRATRSGTMVLVASGTRAGVRTLGLAAAARAGSRYATYSEIEIPAGLYGSQGNDGFIYGYYLGRVSSTTLMATNATDAQLQAHHVVVPIEVAGQHAYLAFASRVGTGVWTAATPWLALVGGTFISGLLGLLIEGMRRRQVDLKAQSALNFHQALHDPLTELPNRTLFRDRIEQEIRRARRHADGAAVMLIDLDRFKEVNDTLGHQSGDALLLGIAERLRGSVREQDTVARLGGDEFGVLAPGVRTAADAAALAATIHAALSAPVRVDELELEVDASIGVALFPEHGLDEGTLVRRADVALYRSKGAEATVVYRSEHDNYSPARLRLLTGLRRAIANGEIVVWYQPKVTSTTGAVCGVEALVRWAHPELGLVMPDEFIPLAEHTDLIRSLTAYVLETAVAQCRAWRDAGWAVSVAINVTGRDLLDASFPDDVAACLERHEIEATSLELEITENTIFSDPVRALSVLDRLSALGVRLAIDDFGSGQSSLGYLSRLPLDVLKIDKSFVLDMCDSPSARTIVRSTIELGHNLGLEVVAEGVENEERRQRLVELECDVVQGFVYGPALPPDEVALLFSTLASPAGELG